MRNVRSSAPALRGLVPYDPKYLPANALLSANENPLDVPPDVRRAVEKAVKTVPFNRYPDPLANDLRDLIAHANGLEREQVIVGNGGDELLFNLALAWGGPGRTFLTMPPTFSVYENNAQLTGTSIVRVPRLADYSIDEDAVLARAALGDIDYMIVTSPNNPTGQLADEGFLLRLLDATDALVLVDEAYFEFSRRTMRPWLDRHENLAILRTFSKAFSLAGVRLGYVLANPGVVRELAKVRQPYSVDAVSQAIASTVFRNREKFELGIDAIIAERGRLIDALGAMPGVMPFPSDANYILFRLDASDAEAGLDAAGDPARAAHVWQRLYDQGILVRDFSHAPGLEGCLRVSVGTRAQNDAFLTALERAL